LKERPGPQHCRLQQSLSKWWKNQVRSRFLYKEKLNRLGLVVKTSYTW